MKVTKQRECILRAVRENEGHYTAEEIFELAKKEYPGIAVATVYNNLNALVEARIIKRISRVGKPDVYDKSICPHEHMICTVCARIFDLDLPTVREELNKSVNSVIEDYDLTVYAKCNECIEKEKNSNIE